MNIFRFKLVKTHPKLKHFVFLGALVFTFLTVFSAFPKNLIKADPIQIDLTGTGYSLPGISAWGENMNISIAINGTYAFSSQTDNTGTFLFPSLEVNPLDTITIYSDDNTSVYAVNTLKIANDIAPGTVTADLYQDILLIQSTGSDAVTMSDLHAGNLVGDADIDHIYKTDSSTNLVSQNNTSIYVWNDSVTNLTGHDTYTRTFGTLEGSTFTGDNIYLTYTLSQGLSTTINSNTIFNGSTDQYILALGAINGNIQINKSGGDLIQESDVNINGTLTITSNTHYMVASYVFDSNGLTIDDGIFESVSGQVTVSGTVNVTGSYLGGSGLNYLSGVQVNSDGYFSSTSSTTYFSGTLSVAETANFQPNGGTFRIENSNLILTSPDATATIIFWNLEVIDSLVDSTQYQIQVKPGVLWDIQGGAYFAGAGENDKVVIRSSVSGTQFDIKFENSTASLTAGFVDVKDSNLTIQNTVGINLPINPDYSVDSYNNTNWFSPNARVIGTVYQVDRATPVGAGREVQVFVNGVYADSVFTDSVGQFQTGPVKFNADDIITIYSNLTFDEWGNRIIKADNDAYNFTHSFDLYLDTLTLQNYSTNPFTPTDLYSAHNGTGLILFDAGALLTNDIIHTSGKLYIPAGSDINFSSLTSGEMISEGAMELSGSLNIGDRKLTVKGNTALNGTFTVGASSPGLFLTSSSQTLSSTATIQSDVTATYSSDLNLNSDIVINGYLKILNGTIVHCNTYNLDATDGIDITGSEYYCATGHLMTDADMNLSTARVDTTGDISAQNINLTNAANVTLGVGNTTVTNLSIVGSSYRASSGDTFVNGNLSIDDGDSFNPNEGTVILRGTNNYINGGFQFYNLSKTIGTAVIQNIYVQSNADVRVLGALTLLGYDATHSLFLSPTATNPFTITLKGTNSSLGTINYIGVASSTIAVDGSSVVLPVDPAVSVDGGNTVGWFTPPPVTQPIVVTQPVSGHQYINSLPIEFTLPESPKSGSVLVTITNLHTLTSGVLFLSDATSYNFNLDFPTIGTLPADVLTSTLTSLPVGYYRINISYQDFDESPVYVSPSITVLLGEYPNIQFTTPTLTSNSSITNATVKVTAGSNDQITASNVTILSAETNAGYSNFNCIQSSSTVVDCSIVITSSGHITVQAVSDVDVAYQSTSGNFVIQTQSQNQALQQNNPDSSQQSTPTNPVSTPVSTVKPTKPVSAPVVEPVDDSFTLATQNGIANTQEQNGLNPLLIIIPLLGVAGIFFGYKKFKH